MDRKALAIFVVGGLIVALGLAFFLSPFASSSSGPPANGSWLVPITDAPRQGAANRKRPSTRPPTA